MTVYLHPVTGCTCGPPPGKLIRKCEAKAVPTVKVLMYILGERKQEREIYICKTPRGPGEGGGQAGNSLTPHSEATPFQTEQSISRCLMGIGADRPARVGSQWQARGL